MKKYIKIVNLIVIVLYALLTGLLFLLASLLSSATPVERTTLFIMAGVLVIYLIIAVVLHILSLKHHTYTGYIVLGIICFVFFNAITGILLLMEANNTGKESTDRDLLSQYRKRD